MAAATTTSSSGSNFSSSSRAALEHLNRLKPLDGWAIDVHPTSKTGVRLLRRNVPLTDTYFFDLHFDSNSRCVVGILTSSRDSERKAQAQVLVDATGSPLNNRKVQLVTVTTWDPTTNRSISSSSPSLAEAMDAASLRDEQNMELLRFAAKHGIVVIVGLWIARVVFTAVFFVYVVTIPILYLYMVQTCPAESSFEAKKELKRVLRGYHLPEDHPEKPKGFLSEALARLTATVVTELSTGLGYEVSLTNFAGAAIFVSVVVPAAKMNCYWIGAFGKWWYVWSREIESIKTD